MHMAKCVLHIAGMQDAVILFGLVSSAHVEYGNEEDELSKRKRRLGLWTGGMLPGVDHMDYRDVCHVCCTF